MLLLPPAHTHTVFFFFLPPFPLLLLLLSPILSSTELLLLLLLPTLQGHTSYMYRGNTATTTWLLCCCCCCRTHTHIAGQHLGYALCVCSLLSLSCCCRCPSAAAGGMCCCSVETCANDTHLHFMFPIIIFRGSSKTAQNVDRMLSPIGNYFHARAQWEMSDFLGGDLQTLPHVAQRKPNEFSLCSPSQKCFYRWDTAYVYTHAHTIQRQKGVRFTCVSASTRVVLGHNAVARRERERPLYAKDRLVCRAVV